MITIATKDDLDAINKRIDALLEYLKLREEYGADHSGLKITLVKDEDKTTT